MRPTQSEMERALEARHGKALQERFSRASVAVCGLGGLGSNVAIALARAGIGRLHLIDFDRVELSNLNRQQYGVSQLGRYKTEAMKQTLSEVAPYCDISIDTVRLTEENVGRLTEAEEIICECLDGAESKAMLVNRILENYPEKYVVAASGMSGLHGANAIQTHRVTKRWYLCGDGESDVEVDGTLFAPRVMCCAAHQANMVLRIVAGNVEV